MTTAKPAATPDSAAARRKTSRNRQYAMTLVHYLGVEEALEVCRRKNWGDVREEIIRRQEAIADAS